MTVDPLKAVRLANDSDYGLTASAGPGAPDRAALAEGWEAGVVTINDCVSSYGEPTAPGAAQAERDRPHPRGLGLREMVQAQYVTQGRELGSRLWWYP